MSAEKRRYGRSARRSRGLGIRASPWNRLAKATRWPRHSKTFERSRQKRNRSSFFRFASERGMEGSRVQTWRGQLYKCRKGEEEERDWRPRIGGMRESPACTNSSTIRGPDPPIRANLRPNGISSIRFRNLCFRDSQPLEATNECRYDYDWNWLINLKSRSRTAVGQEFCRNRVSKVVLTPEFVRGDVLIFSLTPTVVLNKFLFFFRKFCKLKNMWFCLHFFYNSPGTCCFNFLLSFTAKRCQA